MPTLPSEMVTPPTFTPRSSWPKPCTMASMSTFQAVRNGDGEQQRPEGSRTAAARDAGRAASAVGRQAEDDGAPRRRTACPGAAAVSSRSAASAMRAAARRRSAGRSSADRRMEVRSQGRVAEQGEDDRRQHRDAQREARDRPPGAADQRADGRSPRAAPPARRGSTGPAGRAAATTWPAPGR